MALLPVVFDTTTGKTKAAAAGGFVDEDFDVAVGTTTITAVTVFDATRKIDIFIAGRLQREGSGASFSYLRNVGTNSFTFTETIQAPAWVRVRLY